MSVPNGLHRKNSFLAINKGRLRMHSFLVAVVVALFASIALAEGRKPNFIRLVVK